MADLDADEARARATSRFVSAAEAVTWLDDLPALWTASGDPGRPPWKALFEKVEVLGVESVTIHPTPEAGAHGSSDAFGSVPLLPAARRAFSTDGRGERARADTPSPILLIPVTNVPSFVHRSSEIA